MSSGLNLFYLIEANLVPLLTLVAHIHFVLFHFAKYLTGSQYFIHKIGIILTALTGKKINTDWHLFITQMEMKWTKEYTMTSHIIEYRTGALLLGMHIFNFNCFFEDFNCVFTLIHCLSRLLVYSLPLVEAPSKIVQNIENPLL